MKLSTFVLPVLAATLLLVTTGTLVVHAQKRSSTKLPPGRIPPAGEYGCSKTVWGYSGAQNIDGTPMMTIQYITSVLIDIKLDGKSTYYTHSKKSGRYRFNSSTREFAFVSGPLAGWPVVYEVSSGQAMLRLGATTKDKVGKNSRIGEHSCDLEGKRKFANSPPPASVGGPTTVGNSAKVVRNGGARGVLTFRREWGSGNKIIDFNLQTAAIRSRFEGTDPFRNARGETTFVNANGALVIAGAAGTASSTIPVPTALETPDSPVMSPDGTRVAFHVAPIYYDSRVLVANRAGKIIAEFKDMTEPGWTPDGRLLVAKSMGTEESKPGLYLSDKNLQQLKRIDPNLDNASQPAASPDGKRLAFVHHGHIWLMNLDGSGVKQLAFSDVGEKRPAWSPDGKWIVAAKQDDGLVLVINASNGKITEITDREDNSIQSSGRLNWR